MKSRQNKNTMISWLNGFFSRTAPRLVCLVSLLTGMVNNVSAESRPEYEFTVQSPPGYLDAVDVSPDGKFAAATDFALGTIVIWDIRTTRILRHIGMRSSWGSGMAFGPDSRTVVFMEADKSAIQAINVLNGEVIASIGVPNDFLVKRYKLTPEGNHIVGRIEGTNRIFALDAKGWKIVASTSQNKKLFEYFDEILSVYDDYKLIRKNLLNNNLVAACQSSKSSEETVVTISRNGKIIARLSTECAVGDIDCSDDGKLLAAASLAGDSVGVIDVWDLTTSAKICGFVTNGNVNNCRFIPGTDRLLVGVSGSKYSSTLGGLYVLEGRNAKSLRRLPFHGSITTATRLGFSPDGNLLAATGENGEIQLWDLAQLSLRFSLVESFGTDSIIIPFEFTGSGDELICHPSQTESVQDPKTKESVLGARELHTRVYKTANGSLHRKEQPSKEGVFICSNTGKDSTECPASGMRAVVSYQKPSPVPTIRLIHKATGKTKATLLGHKSWITAMCFSPDGKILATAATDQSIRLWNTNTGESVALVALFGESKEWITYTDDGYFDASGEGGGLVGITVGLESYHIDQFAPTHNRPDILMSRIWPDRKSAIERFKHQTDIRNLKMGLANQKEARMDPAKSPVVSLIDKKRNGSMLQVEFALESPGADLSSYTIYSNGSPVKEARNVSISGKQTRKSVEIALTDGPNTIEISCMNMDGSESPRAVLKETLESMAKRNLYFLGIGIDQYKNPEWNLNYAVKDVGDMAEIFRKQGNNFLDIHVKTLFNEQVTSQNIEKCREWISKSGVDDVVIVFIAGHGLYSEGELPIYYYLTGSFDPGRLSETALAFESLEQLLYATPSRRKLFLIDTCQSGDMEPDLAAFYAKAAQSDSRHVRGVLRSVSKSSDSAPAIAPRKPSIADRNRYVFSDLIRRSGAVVFSSCAGNEYSYEDAKYENGLFTEAVIEALSDTSADSDLDGKLSIEEIRNYVAPRVSQMSGGYQNPWTDRDNRMQNIDFPVLAQSAVLRLELTRFVENFLKNSSDLSYIDRMFDETAIYHGKKMKNHEIGSAYANFCEDWPIRLSKLSGDVTILPSSAPGEQNLLYEVRYSHYGKESKIQTRGSSRMQMKIKKINGEWKIIELSQL